MEYAVLWQWPNETEHQRGQKKKALPAGSQGTVEMIWAEVGPERQGSDGSKGSREEWMFPQEMLMQDDYRAATIRRHTTS